MVDGHRSPHVLRRRRSLFGTNNKAGLCIHFDEKVRSPFSRKGHSALTVTVADLEGLERTLRP